MRLYILVFLLGAVGGGFIAYKLAPKSPETVKTEYKDKIVTRTRIIREPSGTIVKEVEKTEDKQGTKASPPLIRHHMINVSVGHNGTKTGTYGYKVFDHTWLTVGASDKKELFLGVTVEF